MANVTVEIEGKFPEYFWVVREEKPVKRLFRSYSGFNTRTAAMKDFQNTCEILGWENDAMEVRL